MPIAASTNIAIRFLQDEHARLFRKSMRDVRKHCLRIFDCACVFFSNAGIHELVFCISELKSADMHISHFYLYVGKSARYSGLFHNAKIQLRAVTASWFNNENV